MTDRTIVIGLGTGRCGTASLAKLLRAQHGSMIGHEQAPTLPWERSYEAARAARRWLHAQNGSLVGDVAHAWLPYAVDVHIAFPRVRFVALWRATAATVRSFLHHMPDDYIQTDGPYGRNQFPSYDLRAADAWHHYVTVYKRRMINFLPEKTTLHVPTEALSHPEGQACILKHIGISSDQQVILDECHENRTVAGP